MEVVSEKKIQTPDTASLIVIGEETAGSQEKPEPLSELYAHIGAENRENSPDLIFDDNTPQAKKPAHASQDDVYY